MVQVLISRHESKRKKQRKIQKDNSPQRVKRCQRRARGEQFQNVPKATRHQRATREPKARDSQWRMQGELRRRAIPESNKNHSPSTRQRRTKGEQLATASDCTREAS